MALVKPVIFQVAGFQNSGKTTLSLKLIERLSALGLKVATIKHHGHGGKPEVSDRKDSVQHVSAGAAASLVAGEGRIIIQAEQKEWSLEEEIELLTFFAPDVILIEGYKKKSYDKAVIIRNEADLELLQSLDGVKIIFYRESVLAGRLNDSAVPVYCNGDGVGLTWITNYIVKQLKAGNS